CARDHIAAAGTVSTLDYW
nr:immunoglobulin heavy chain junction region [Macaca mulatta]MOW23794.1 immunoglobulin heavy chain junction region [Macaca mulatta]MOW23963.1 immunoglobulin heavy chain junction region [Macaca mulatta]MOW24752.1 immunoglobulin heavy chain junction region [Macaca mulatta]MOW24818.1 immunoglobulin heavy chain junction region [Macaca mulatta]